MTHSVFNPFSSTIIIHNRKKERTVGVGFEVSMERIIKVEREIVILFSALVKFVRTI
jgi:hypothetical protein